MSRRSRVRRVALLVTVLMLLAVLSGVRIHTDPAAAQAGATVPAGTTSFFIGGDVWGITVRCMTVRDGVRSGHVLLIRW